MGKTYHLDLETLLSILDNKQYQLTTTLTVSSAPATAFVTLTKGKITSYFIQLRDGRRINGDQVFNQLLAQSQWDVQLVENRLQPQRDTLQSGEYQHQPAPTPMPASNPTTSPLPPVQSQQAIPNAPYRPTYTGPLTSGMGQGPTQTAATEQKPYNQRPAQSMSITNPQHQLPQTSPGWQNPVTPLWSYLDTTPAMPVGNILNPHHCWQQKSSLQAYHLTNIPSQQRRTLHVVLTMVNGRRTTADIQSALGLPPDAIVAAIETLANLNVIE